MDIRFASDVIFPLILILFLPNLLRCNLVHPQSLGQPPKKRLDLGPCPAKKTNISCPLPLILVPPTYHHGHRTPQPAQLCQLR